MSRSTGHGLRPGRKVVALGGGHGLYSSLSALRHLTDELTAVVTVADDGGSSGRLRRELGLLPPGDLRMALAALCDDSEWGRTWRDVIQHRFTGDGELAGHAVGNLLIASLWQLLDEPVRDYVLGQQGAEEFVERYVSTLEPVLAGYRREHRPFVTVAVGCTGGKHRSVALAEEVARHLRRNGGTVQVNHRDRLR